MRQLPTHVIKKSQMPQNLHWVILKYKTITTPAYEGGTSTEDIVEYNAYTTRESWEAAILELEERYTKEPYHALEVKPAKVKVSVSLGIE